MAVDNLPSLAVQPAQQARVTVPSASSANEKHGQKRVKQSRLCEKNKKKNTKTTTSQSPDNKPLYQILGAQLLASAQPSQVAKNLPSSPFNLTMIPVPPVPYVPLSPLLQSQKPSNKDPRVSSYEVVPRSRSAVSLLLPRRSIDNSSTFSGSTRIIQDEESPSTKYKVKGAIYNLRDFNAMHQVEHLVQRYGRVAHMGVRDPTYTFWMNRTRSAVVHFKIINKVAVLGGDPICHPDCLALVMQEFEVYCKSVGWKTAVIAASKSMLVVAQARGWTTMHFGTETALNPQTNEVLLGKSGKRIVTQCKQLLDPLRGGVTVHAYCPSLGRDSIIESELKIIYDDWRTARNISRESQAFITVFDLFAMHNLMTFLYTRDKDGKINGFSALRQLGEDLSFGYHIDPFIQSADAPRGVSDLLIYASLAFLNAKGITYLSLGFEPLASVGEISGLPSAFHGATRKVYKHVFGRIPVGGKEAFHARWKLDAEQETPLYLICAGRIPSPRLMVAMTHYANISLRSIVKQDLEELRNRSKKDSSTDSETSIREDGREKGHDLRCVNSRDKTQ